MPTKREEGVECCYARQTKFWAHDPDGNLWEVYTFDGDIDHRGAGQSEEVVLATTTPRRAEPVVWEHRMNEPVPARIPLARRRGRRGAAARHAQPAADAGPAAGDRRGGGAGAEAGRPAVRSRPGRREPRREPGPARPGRRGAVGPVRGRPGGAAGRGRVRRRADAEVRHEAVLRPRRRRDAGTATGGVRPSARTADRRSR